MARKPHNYVHFQNLVEELKSHNEVNNEMIAPTPFLKPLCEICNVPKEYKIKIEELFKKEFSTDDIKNRELILNKY